LLSSLRDWEESSEDLVNDVKAVGYFKRYEIVKKEL